MAVRVTGAGDYPDTFDYEGADGFEIGSDDCLRVHSGDVAVAVFHRSHWSRAEIVTTEIAES
ncbi:hypothetical protein [Nocardia abscessus]|uniref:hypothetical protein n=1 Tax=Nocardia abscessus TaxID=120957 RepID=UPI00245836F1|nr:hypothetical protein [Nocardia abscessus]